MKAPRPLRSRVARVAPTAALLGLAFASTAGAQLTILPPGGAPPPSDGADAPSSPSPTPSQAGGVVTVYSSLPLQGAARAQTRAVVKGARLALSQAGGRAGAFGVRYVSLDDSTPRAGGWTPRREAANARRAARDPAAVAYVGAFNSGASAISIPILNVAGIAQVSPSNTFNGLTTGEPGSSRGEPQKYYPTGRRTYARIVPRDTIQGVALAALMRRSRCRRVFLLHDREVYGAGLAASVRRAARRRALRIVGFRGIRTGARGYRGLARRVRRSGARCVMFGGITANNAVRLFRDLARGVPRAKLFGGDGIAESGFTDPREGGVPRSVGRRVRVTVATLPTNAYPGGRRFAAAYRAAYGERNPDPYALFGYEAMGLVLDSISRAGPAGGDRRAVVAQLFATRDRQSALGTYSIGPSGDTTLTDYGVYRVARGELRYVGVVRP